MMLNIKYESSGLCSFAQEDFWKLNLKTYFLTPWPTCATNWNGLNICGRGLPCDHSCDVRSKSNERFQRRKRLSEHVDAWRTTTDDEQGSRTIAHHERFVLRWAKITCLAAFGHLVMPLPLKHYVFMNLEIIMSDRVTKNTKQQYKNMQSMLRPTLYSDLLLLCSIEYNILTYE